MKYLLVLVIPIATLLTACGVPEYGAKHEATHQYVEPNAVEVLTFNGYAVEVTEDNTLKIRVPKAGELIEDGLNINADGIVEVALSSIQLPNQNQPLGEVTNDMIEQIVEGNELTIEVPQDGLTTDQVMGYVYVGNENLLRLQDILLENGLAIVDKTSPYIETYMKEFNTMQTAAENGSLGIWAIDGFIRLSENFDAQFTELGQYNEEQAQKIIQELKSRGWTVDNLLQDYLP